MDPTYSAKEYRLEAEPRSRAQVPSVPSEQTQINSLKANGDTSQGKKRPSTAFSRGLISVRLNEEEHGLNWGKSLLE